jgi:hypothetical protein
VLLSEEPDAIDHLLRARAGRLQPAVETGVLALQKLNALGGDHALASRCLESLEASLSLQSAATECGELVTEMLYELLELGERCCFRTYAV